MSSTAPWRTVRCRTLRTRCCRCIPGKIRIASRCAAPAPVGEDVDTPDDIAPASASPAESRTRRDAARTRTAPRAEGRRVPNPRRPRRPLVVRARPSAAPAAATRRTTRRRSAGIPELSGQTRLRQPRRRRRRPRLSHRLPPDILGAGKEGGHRRPPPHHPSPRGPPDRPAAIQVRCSSGSILRGLRSGNDRISDLPPRQDSVYHPSLRV